jgi:hypothetical protein
MQMIKLLSVKRMFAFGFAAIVVAGAARPMNAQTALSGTIAGVVTDASGAVVADSPVVITDTDTGVARTMTTDGSGAYTAPFLQSGHYEVVLGGVGFARVDRKNLVLTVGQTLTVDATLSAGSVATEVNVTSASPILDPQKTEVSQTLDTNFVANLPVATRNWSNFVLLTPNVVQDGGSGLISFHGISGLYNQNYVDGANNNQVLFSEARGRAAGAPFIYSVDSIKEFQAETSNYSVEFGQAAGGQVNAITKNGTNAIHGDLFYELRYPSLNALDPYTKFVALHNTSNPAVAGFLLTQPVHQQQEFGGSVGGPVIKDRLFYFFTYDGFRRVGKALYTDSNTLSQIASGVTASTTTITPTQCPMTITATQCSNGIAFLIAQSTAAPSRFAKENLFFPRLDWHINSKNNAFVDFNFADFDSSYGYSSANTFSNASPSSNGPTSYHERFVVGALTTQVGNASVNEFHGQWGRDLETAGAYASGPSVATGVVTFGMPNALPRVAEPDEHRIQLTDVFSTTHGRHSLKFGGDANLVHEVMINLFQGGGIYNYSGSTPLVNFQSWIQDAYAGQAGNSDPYAGYHYTSFVQTVDTLNTAAGTQGKDDFWIKMYDGFAEDNWKLATNFTLSVGVRYDIQLTPAPGTVNNNFPPVSTKYSSSIKNVSDRVQPRIGFAWSPYAGTVVRGGYGLYSALNQGSTYYAMRVENGVVQVNYNYSGCGATNGAATASCATAPTGASLLMYPNVPFPVTGPSLSGALHPTGGAAPAVSGPTKVGAQSFHGLDPNFVPPLAHEFSLSVEQAMPGKLSLQVGYVGTRALRLPVFVDANLVGRTPHGARTYNVVDAKGSLMNQITVPVYLPSDRINQSLATFNTGFSVANTWYNSLAVTVRRPFANGLQFLGNFTWAKATDTGQVQGNFGTFYGGDTPLDPNNIRGENGPSDIDVRNRGTISVVYQPHVFADNKFVKHTLDDFVFSATDIASSGQPISLVLNGTIYSGSTSPTSYGDDGGIYGGAISSSSGLPSTGSSGGRPPQIGRNSITGPGFNAFDVRVAREIPIYGRLKLQFAADAFNVLNHTIITGVNQTYSQYSAAAAPTGSTPNPACNATTQTPGTAAAPLQGCIAPYSGTGLSAFGVRSSTNNGLYTARQMQFSAKLIF